MFDYCIPKYNSVISVHWVTFVFIIKKEIHIIGGGAVALFLASKLNSELFKVVIYEKNQALGRKFLVAGKGGFNLTHSESEKTFVEKYGSDDLLRKVFLAYPNLYFRNWLKEIGVETFVGTSKRVFPKKGIKPVDVLNKIQQQLKQNKVEFKFNHQWLGWDENNHLLFKHKNETKRVLSNISVFALGGASWKVTGSDGLWLNYFKEKNIDVVTFEPSNCAYNVPWLKEVLNSVVGKALKNVAFTCGKLTQKGEAVLTEFGIEGSGVYPLSREVREALNKKGEAIIYVDLKPTITEATLLEKLKERGNKNTKDILRSVKLSDEAIALVKHTTNKADYQSALFLAHYIKHFPITVKGLANIDEAISTVGGVSLNALTHNFELKKMPNTYCIGEMLDWDAPTGGYLLQMCFSMGCYLADVLNKSK